MGGIQDPQRKASKIEGELSFIFFTMVCAHTPTPTGRIEDPEVCATLNVLTICAWETLYVLRPWGGRRAVHICLRVGAGCSEDVDAIAFWLVSLLSRDVSDQYVDVDGGIVRGLL